MSQANLWASAVDDGTPVEKLKLEVDAFIDARQKRNGLGPAKYLRYERVPPNAETSEPALIRFLYISPAKEPHQGTLTPCSS